MLGSYGLLIVTVACAAWASLATWSVHDPSLNNATRAMPRNVLGSWGAVVADLAIQSLGLASIILFLPLAAWGWHLVFRTAPARRRMRLLAWPCSVILLAAALAALPQPKSWPLPNGLGGIFGDFFMAGAHVIGPFLPDAAVSFVAGIAFFVIGTMMLLFACGTSTSRLIALWAPRSGAAGEWANAWIGAAMHYVMHAGGKLRRLFGRRRDADAADDDDFDESVDEEDWQEEREPDAEGRIEPSFGPSPIGEAFDEEDEEEERHHLAELSHHPHQPGRKEEKAHRPVAQRAVGRAVRDAVDQAAAAGIPREQSPQRQRRSAAGECPRARRRAARFRRQGRDHQCPPRTGGHALRARAGARHQVLARDRPCRRHRPFDERASPPASPSCPAATPSASSFPTIGAKSSCCAR